MFLSLLTPAFAHYPHTEEGCPTTEELGSTEECLVEQRQSAKEMKFVDMFFSDGADNVGGSTTSIPKKIEVAPGDGTAILVAVMANSGSFELTGIKGWLGLPLGFQAAGRSAGQPAFDTYDLSVQPGKVLVFEFPVTVADNIRVGMYKATLHVEYFKARDVGLNYRDFEVEFLLPGKSVLDAIATDPVLVPSTNNNVEIEITNEGSAAASGAIIKLGDVEDSGIISVGSKIWNVGVIKPHDKAVIDAVLYVNPTLVNTNQNLSLDISYFDAYGEKQSTTIRVDYIVAGTTTGSIDFRISTDRPVIPTITPVPLTVTITNTGVETSSSVEVTVSTPITATVALNQQVPEASKSPIMIIGGDGYTRIGTIGPGETRNVEVMMFASEEAVNTAFQLPVTISYLDPSGGLKKIQRFVSVYVQGTFNVRVYDLSVTYISNEPNLSGYLLNEGTNLALFTTVELVDNQEMVRQAGSSQYLGDLTANSPLPFNIPVAFAEGAKPGEYPVTIKISYKDDLRVPFEITIDDLVSYEPLVVRKQKAPSIYPNIGIFAGIGVAGAVGYYFARRRRAHARKIEPKAADDDLDFLGGSK